MSKNTERPNTVFFWLELALATVIPFDICWSLTPTNVLYSNPLLGLLGFIGLSGMVLIFFAGIPMGIIGIIKAKRTGKLRIATILLSILNLVVGLFENAILIMIFCAVVFGGVSV